MVEESVDPHLRQSRRRHPVYHLMHHLHPWSSQVCSRLPLHRLPCSLLPRSRIPRLAFRGCPLCPPRSPISRAVSTLKTLRRRSVGFPGRDSHPVPQCHGRPHPVPRGKHRDHGGGPLRHRSCGQDRAGTRRSNYDRRMGPGLCGVPWRYPRGGRVVQTKALPAPPRPPPETPPPSPLAPPSLHPRRPFRRLPRAIRRRPRHSRRRHRRHPYHPRYRPPVLLLLRCRHRIPLRRHRPHWTGRF